MSTITSTVLVRTTGSDHSEVIAVAGLLAGYAGTTRTSYGTDLRIFAEWCRPGGLTVSPSGDAHSELFGRWRGRDRPHAFTVGRRLSTLASFYRSCEQEQVIARNPALNVRPLSDN